MTSETALHSELQAGVEQVRLSPKDGGVLELIVRRPSVDERELLQSVRVDPAFGMEGDSWKDRPSKTSDDGGPHPLKQITIMNARAALLVAGTLERRALAGDQLFIDMDLSYENLPPGTRLVIGDAVLEVSEPPHRGCKKFSDRFGVDALRLVNSEIGNELNLRGINCRVVQAGTLTTGDTVDKDVNSA